MGEKGNPLGSPRHRWVNFIKIYLIKINWGGKDCIPLAEDKDP
jgi:hypothetical protein